MPPGKALVWLPNEEIPRVARIKGYFEIPQLARRADPNPYYRGGGSARRQTGGGAGVAVGVGLLLLVLLLLDAM
jgi:hypothetical protein